MNSWKMARCGLAITWVSTLSRPRWAMPSTISFMPSAPPRLMICSSAGISDSPPSRPKRLVPLYLTSMNCSKPSASTSFCRIAFLPSAVKATPLSGPSMRSWIQAFSSGIGDVHELDAERRAVGPLENFQHLADGGVFEPQHLVDEDAAVIVGLGEAVGLRRQFLVVLERLGEPQRVEVGVQVAAHAVGADHHDGAHRIARRAQHVGIRDDSGAVASPSP